MKKPSLFTYKAKCRLVLALSTVVVVVLPFLNVLRLDIPTLRFYFFNSVLWVDEFHLLFLILMMVLWLIVFFSMLYGRVWCGWMCPQTTIVQLTHWFESNAARLLRFEPKRSGVWRRVAYHGAVAVQLAVLCLIIGFNLVAYFVDPYRMLSNLATWSMHPVVAKIIVGIAVLIFVDALFWRERFCTKACPYGMMQVLVTDAKTQIMLYDNERADDCVECGACVRCCPTGIDIRTSPYQTECIYCGDCVDECNRILGNLKKPKPGLISFSWGKMGTYHRWYEKLGFVDAKRWIILGLTVVFAAGLVIFVNARRPLSLSAAGDRSTLYRQDGNERVYNDYTVRAENRSLVDGVFFIECRVAGNPAECVVHLEENPFPLRSRESRTLKLSVSASRLSLPPGPNRLVLSMRNVEDAAVVAGAEVAFFMPEKPVERDSAGDPDGLKGEAS